MNTCWLCGFQFNPAKDSKGKEINIHYCEKCLEIEE